MSNWFVDEMPGEVPFEEIKKRSSEYHDWGFVPETMQEIGYESVNEKLKTYTAEKYEAFDDAGKEQMVNDVLAIYRSIDLLPIQYYSELGVMNEIEKCIAYKAQFDGDTVSCVDGETEFFTGKGWKKIRDFVKGDKVLQYNEDGSGQLVDPIRYIHYKSDDPFYEYDNGVFNSCLTGNHDVVFEDCNSKCFKMKMKDVVEKGGKVDAFVPIALSCMFRDDNLTVYGGKDFFVLLTKLIHEKSEIKDGYFVLKDSYDWHGSDSVAPSDLKERLKCLEDDEVIWYFVIGDCGTNLYLKGDILNKCLEVKDGVVVDFSTNLYNLDRWSIGDFLAAVSDERGAMHKELSPRAYDLAQFFSIITGNAYYVSEFDEFAEGQDYLEALKETGSFL